MTVPMAIRKFPMFDSLYADCPPILNRERHTEKDYRRLIKKTLAILGRSHQDGFATSCRALAYDYKLFIVQDLKEICWNNHASVLNNETSHSAVETYLTSRTPFVDNMVAIQAIACQFKSGKAITLPPLLFTLALSRQKSVLKKVAEYTEQFGVHAIEDTSSVKTLFQKQPVEPPQTTSSSAWINYGVSPCCRC